MKRLVKFFRIIFISLLIFVALLLTALRFVTPEVNRFRSEIEQILSNQANLSVKINHIESQWNNLGPSFELQGLEFKNDDGLVGSVEKVSVGLDVWRSLFYFRLQLRDFTFYQLKLDIPKSKNEDPQEIRYSVTRSKIAELLLEQFENFDLRDSEISFFSPSGRQVKVDVPHLNWLNQKNRHRAEGRIGLSDIDGQYGYLELRIDLKDSDNLLDNGVIYLQADDINMRPWFNRWLRRATGLVSADFSLSAWLYINHGLIDSGDLLLKQGRVVWHEKRELHQLDVLQQALKINKEKDGWLVELPHLNLATDNAHWLNGKIQAKLFLSNPDSLDLSLVDQLRIRAANLSLDHITPLMPIFSFLSSDTLDVWNKIKPLGTIKQIALDVPLNQPEKMRFDVQWNDVSWTGYDLIPSVNHFAGAARGNKEQGEIYINLNQSLLPYDNVFRVPLEVTKAKGNIFWTFDDNGFNLHSPELDVQANSIWINGSFDYTELKNQDPWLSILAGIRLYDAKQAWRYFPENLMGTSIVEYLTASLQGGQVDTATLIYAGNPQKFPYENKDGLFEVVVPLRNARFQYQPDWPALEQLAIDLDFINDGLWMNAPQTMLGNVIGKDIEAIIPKFNKEQLMITAEVQGDGADVHQYFTQTPLRDSIASTLEHIQVKGNVKSTLHLDIPLNGGLVKANGKVTLTDNQVTIKPIDSTLEAVSGQFTFDNGHIVSTRLMANWFGQPVNINFNTQDKKDNFKVNVNLQGDWLVNQLPWLPKNMTSHLSGKANWQSNVIVSLPYDKPANYLVDLTTNLAKVKSSLPEPLNKQVDELWPVNIKVKGGLNGFNLQAIIADNKLNSQWLLSKEHAQVTHAHWKSLSQKMPDLPKEPQIIIDLPAIKLNNWLDFVQSTSAIQMNSGIKVNLPQHIILNSPLVNLIGQDWDKLSIDINNKKNVDTVKIKGQDIDAELTLFSFPQPWLINLNYLYYNPKWPEKSASSSISFKQWPSFDLSCQECWLFGQRINKVEGEVRITNNTLTLNKGLVDTGVAILAINGTLNDTATHITGSLSGDNFNEATRYFGVLTPLRESSFNLNFDLGWNGTLSQPQRDTLNGTISGELKKGYIANIGGGRAGQLLRLVSFDALLRKLQFDFSDIFGAGFYFNNLKSEAYIEKGIMTVSKLKIDGLAADVTMSGKIDLLHEKLNLNVEVSPEISAGVGVATAFVVNPVAGAIAYVGSKVFNPLWSKIFKISYTIEGDIEAPVIKEKAIEHIKTDKEQRNREK